MSKQSELEAEIAALLIEALDIDDIEANELDPQAPLFGDAENSLGLDSIDALEISLAIKQQYNVELRADDENNKRIFANVQSLAAWVAEQR